MIFTNLPCPVRDVLHCCVPRAKRSMTLLLSFSISIVRVSNGHLPILYSLCHECRIAVLHILCFCTCPLSLSGAVVSSVPTPPLPPTSPRGALLKILFLVPSVSANFSARGSLKNTISGSFCIGQRAIVALVFAHELPVVVLPITAPCAGHCSISQRPLFLYTCLFSQARSLFHSASMRLSYVNAKSSGRVLRRFPLETCM